MTLKEQLTEDMKAAMKAHDKQTKDTISFVRAAIKQVEVDTRTELEDSDVIAILTKQVKMRKDAIAEFEKGGRQDLVEENLAEIAVLEKYLPEQLSYEKIVEVVKEVAAGLGIEGGKENMGKLMGPCMGKLKGLADGNEVRKAVQEFLA